MSNCEYCGTKLKQTTWGRWFCPNCGIQEESNTNIENNENMGYIG